MYISFDRLKTSVLTKLDKNADLILMYYRLYKFVYYTEFS